MEPSPSTYSITVGIGARLVSFVIIKIALGKIREIHPLMWVSAVLFVVRLADVKAALVGSACAQAAAAARANDLVGEPELTHAPLAGVIAGCAPATTAAENLSRARATPADIVTAWMGRPGTGPTCLTPT